MSLPLLGAGMATDGPSAVLDLNFASLLSLTPSVGPTPSFTRASTGTYFNSSGVLTSAAINAPRFNHVYNGVSWVSKGLLIEEARTNSSTYSEDISNGSWTKTTATISANSAAAPDGTTTADLCYPTTTGNYRGFYKSFGSASVTTTIFAKSAGKTAFAFIANNGNDVGASFDLSSGTVSNVFSGHTATITPVGNGWYRCSLSATTTVLQVFIQDSQGTSVTSTTNSTDGILFWGAQLESGAFPTSYIPTTAAAVTRSADVCQITGSDFTSFWNASEGSFAVEYDQSQYAAGSSNFPVAVSTSGTIFVAIASGLYGGSPSTYFQVYNGTAQAEIPFSMVANGTSFKFSSAYKANDFAATQNGSAVGTDLSGSVPSVNQMSIGYFSGFGQYINGHIARLRYYNTRLLNSQLVALST